VCEDVLADPALTGPVLRLYQAAMAAFGRQPVDFPARIRSYPPTRFSFSQLLAEADIPAGPHLQRLKLQLRQLEIDGTAPNPDAARNLMRAAYLTSVHPLREHLDKVVRYVAGHQDYPDLFPLPYYSVQ